MYQPPGFESHEFSDHVYKLDKVLYELKKVPRAWYERLLKFSLEKEFTRGKINNTLSLMKTCKYSLILQIYVGDISFGSTNESICKEFAKLIGSEF